MIRWTFAQHAETAAEPADEAEAVRATAFRNEADRRSFLGARAQARALFARVIGCAATDLKISADEAGRPFLTAPETRPISWSRSGPLALAAIGERAHLGVDVERIRDLDWRSMLAMATTEIERAAILELGDAAASHRAFVRAWTAKEAILKLRGVGLAGDARTASVPPDYLTDAVDGFDVPLAGRIRVESLPIGPSAVAAIAYAPDDGPLYRA